MQERIHRHGNDRKKWCTVLSTYEGSGQSTVTVSISIYDEALDSLNDIINFYHRASLLSTFLHRLEQASAIGGTSSGSSVKIP